MFLWQRLSPHPFLLSVQTINKHALINFTLRWTRGEGWKGGRGKSFGVTLGQ